ncbi:MAG: hypothetical protein NTY99_00220 [DPANN group archaeon]|nr:hypothetical protein [DPANN group archaeon]
MTQAEYFQTNEDLASIVRGMNVKPTDYILAVGGSGDQAFALLEYAKRVKIVYASNGETICNALRESGFVLDDFMTSRTWDESWNPAVLKKSVHI